MLEETPPWVRTDRFTSSLAHADVLLIEDDPDLADMYALGLRLGGHPVRVAESPDQALGPASDERPKVIVLDLEMKRSSGWEILTRLRLRATTAAVPVLVLSNESEDFGDAFRQGATECLTTYRTTPNKLLSYVEAAIRGFG